MARWRDLKGRLGDIAISTIDAFCLSLLREFPLEADVDPGFDLANETEVPRLIDESLDQALRVCRAVAREDEDVALVFAQLGERRLRAGIAASARSAAGGAAGPAPLSGAGTAGSDRGGRVPAGGGADRAPCSRASEAASSGFSRTDRPSTRNSRCSLRTSGVWLPARNRSSRDAAAEPECRKQVARDRFPRQGGRAAFRALLDRLRALLPHAGWPSAREELQRDRLQGDSLRQRRRLEASPLVGRAARAGDRGRHPSVPPRSERRDVPRRLADLRHHAAAVSADARCARAARFFRRAGAGGDAA